MQQSPLKLQFSPTLSSILGYAGAFLSILHLDGSPPPSAIESTVVMPGKLLDAFSPHGTYIITTYYQQSTVTITNLDSQTPLPSQFIDTNLKVSEIVLTGNVLLVNGSDVIVGWLLTEDGVVDGVLGGRRADHCDSLWKISPETNHSARPHQEWEYEHLEFAVKDEIAAIKHNGYIIHAYHIRTGEVIKPPEIPTYSPLEWYRFNNPLHGSDCYLYHHKLSESLNYNWPVSQSTLQEGWVNDPEGNHRLWLHPHWRSATNKVDWLEKVTTMRLGNSSESVVIKF
jgi:hypothetical protein